MRITRAQIALVHIANKRLGFDKETYRAVLLKHGGVESASDLSPAGFARVMRYFTAWGFRSDWTKRTYGNRPGMATPSQVDTIRRLWREWSGADDEMTLNRWLERSYHIGAVRFLSSEMASKAINGLKAMCGRKGKEGDYVGGRG